jgi:hypothetical protein
MTIQVLGSAIIRTTRGVGDWAIWAVEQPGGIARVEDRSGLTEIVVADAPRCADSADSGYAAIACTLDGGAFVMSSQAPPALLVDGSGCRTAPEGPDAKELLHLGDDERLLLLSASVLEARPEVLATALRRPSHTLLRCDPVELLARLFREVHHGAGVVVGRTQPPTEPKE